MNAAPMTTAAHDALGDGATSLISENYREIQRELHQDPNYGVASIQRAPMVVEVANQLRPASILDYGAGKGRLYGAIKPKLAFDFEMRYYEPAVPMWADPAEPADLVACIDVLEHIEPDCIDAVLDDLRRVTAKIGLFTVSCVPAKKILSDGRNAHLIQEKPEWWMPKLFARFEVKNFVAEASGFCVLVARKDP